MGSRRGMRRRPRLRARARARTVVHRSSAVRNESGAAARSEHTPHAPFPRQKLTRSRPRDLKTREIQVRWKGFTPLL